MEQLRATNPTKSKYVLYEDQVEDETRPNKHLSAASLRKYFHEWNVFQNWNRIIPQSVGLLLGFLFWRYWCFFIAEINRNQIWIIQTVK
jgi:hypothetical protein